MKPTYIHVTLVSIVVVDFRGGIQSILGRPELERVMQRRRPDADGKVGSIRPTEKCNRGSCMDNELETHLSRRSKAIENVRNLIKMFILLLID